MRVNISEDKMQLTSLEDKYGKKKWWKFGLGDDLPLSPLMPDAPKPCNSCNKKQPININITNTANGNTASGTSNSDNGFENNQTDNSKTGQSPTSSGISAPPVRQQYGLPVTHKNFQLEQPKIIETPNKDDGVKNLLEKINQKLDAPRPLPSTIEGSVKPAKDKNWIKEREVKIPVERKVNYIKPTEQTYARSRDVPYIQQETVNYPQDRVKWEIKEREVPTFFDRVKKKVIVLRENQPPAPASFT